jgi:hypothetical protein
MTLSKERSVSEAIVFASICPVCRDEQVQHRFSVASLHRLLKAGRPIEAYCEVCDAHWLIGAQQRLELGDVVSFWGNSGAHRER